MQGRMGPCAAAFQGPPPVGNDHDEKQHLIPPNISSVLLMLVRGWHNPETQGAPAVPLISSHQPGWEARERRQLWGGGGTSPRFSFRNGLPGAGAVTGLNPVRRRHWWEADYEADVFGSCSISFCPFP